MTEEEARDWLASTFGGVALDVLAAFVNMVVAENKLKNLIAPSTLETIWSRHIVDSAQLIKQGRPGLWIDVGTGGGFPGMVVALLRTEPILMVEPRRRRADFLEGAVASLNLAHARVTPTPVEKVTEGATTISARAVAPIEKLLQIAAGCAKDNTRWLLPRGKLTDKELAAVSRSWPGVFHVEQSVTDPLSSILILDGRIAR